MASTTVYLNDYQPPHFSIDSVNLKFDLFEEYTLVENTMLLTAPNPGALVLHGDELELVSIAYDGVGLTQDDYSFQDSNLVLETRSKTFELKIITRIYPDKNTKLSGLFRSNALFCTQCEAEGFRRITYFLDRPDVLTLFSTRISADKTEYPTLLSNGNLIAQGEEENGRHWALWRDPFKKPSYLFALVAGTLASIEDEFITQSGKAVTLKIFVEPGQEDKCTHAMESIKKSMRWDEKVYGREYDLSIFMIVAVSDFNMGAMENKGLNIFNSKYILARPETATDQDFMGVESVVAHEYFHNWTGNRVTCRDWFQLSLKEGLTVFRDQEFSRDMNSRDVNRIQDVKTLRASQFPEDASAMAHPVRPSSYEEINNFYTATIYNKGAEVIRMQHTLLGEEGFRQGMDLYFARHDGQAVTIDDFVQAMEDANQVDFSQLKRWYTQAGTPEVRVETEFKENTLVLTLSQTCAPTPETTHKLPFHIPLRMALYDKQGHLLPNTELVLELKESTQQFQFNYLSETPIVSLLRDFSAPIKLQQSLSTHERITLLQCETNGYAKWNNAQCLALASIKQFLLSESAGLPPSLINAFKHILLDTNLDTQLRAELLMPPGYEEVIADLTEVDPVRVEQARDKYRKLLGVALYPELNAVYLQLSNENPLSTSAIDIGKRKLKNSCLWLMMKASEAQSVSLCIQQFELATTMTDQLASFALLCSSQDKSVRDHAIQAFYAQWAHDDLVLDKWFAMQAVSELPYTLLEVRALLEHPLFSIKNPNKVRALIGAFTQGNPRNFHAADGSGYAFLTDIIITLDKINPQIAARLATPFTRWQRMGSVRQTLLKAELAQLSALNLSRDLSEIIHKSLN